MECDLFTLTTDCGCAAKVPAGLLGELLADLPQVSHPDLMVGPETMDDAGVFRLPNGTVLVQTIDFFPPVARDGADYGRIAAANALSDIYAMGGTPMTALAMLCFPVKRLPKEVLAAIMRGAAEKLHEAGTVLLGGHSVIDPLPKFGLAVTGTVSEDRVLDNAKAQPGDTLILTKAIGTGVTIMAIKAGLTSAAQETTVNTSMASLNRVAADLALEHGVRACTDITGFGLLGHACHIARASGVTLRINIRSIPLLDGVLDFASMGLLSAAAYSNRAYVQDRVVLPEDLPMQWQDLLVDPQTSGGLLLTCPPENAQALLSALQKHLSTPCAIIGEVVARQGNSEIHVF